VAADKQILEPCETFHKAVNFDAGIAPLFSDLSSEAFVETFVETLIETLVESLIDSSFVETII